MSGFFGVASRTPCTGDLFYGTDYHSHLGTRRGGMAVVGPEGFTRVIHNIENAQFRSKFDPDLSRLNASMGIGIISDTEDQPLLIRSRLGDYAIVTVGAVRNAEALAREAFERRRVHLAELGQGELNATEVVAALINLGGTFEEGIRLAQEAVEGSCSLLILTREGIYAARDRYGRTPVILGQKENAVAVSLESCAFPNLGYETVKDLGPGEVVFLTPDRIEQRAAPGSTLQICGFLWVYYGYPASTYEGRNVEAVRYRCGAALARRFPAEIDFVAGIPDSGIGHGLGYAASAGVPFQRPFVKYTPTWARSFMPQNQDVRDLVARMKLIPVRELVEGHRILFCEDSIVRGTQLKDTIQRLYEIGAREVHMRPACPPLVFGCKFLNFSRSRSEMDLAARQAIRALEGQDLADPSQYAQADNDRYLAAEDWIRRRLNLTTLKYQRMEDLIGAIGLPKERICTYCWDGVEVPAPDPAPQ